MSGIPVLLLLFMILPSGAGLPSGEKSSPNPTAFSPEIARVKTGIFKYRDLKDGRQIGSDSASIRRLDASGNLEITAQARFVNDSSGFNSQRWEAVTSPGFQPISAGFSLVSKNETVPVFALRYAANQVTGFAMKRTEEGTRVKRKVEAYVPDDIVDQRIDWVAILCSSLVAGSSFEFQVFDPETGVSHVIAHVEPPLDVQVPAGTFKAVVVDYRVEKRSGFEHYRLFVNDSLPHMMLREEFPNGVTSELLTISGVR